MSAKQPIGVIGVGWVGLVTAACFAELGHEVWAVDIDAAKVEALRRGEVPMHEPGLEELVQRGSERLHFTTDIADAMDAARLLFCCVDTPPTYSGDADLSRVRAVVEKMVPGGEHALVMKSTVPSGTGRAIKRDLPGVAYVSCPEFLKEGSAVEDFMHPDRVVIGVDPGDEWAADAVQELYEPLGGELVRTDLASSEMIKLASNAFLATKISFINEIANVSEEVGADVAEVARGMGLDDRIGPSFLKAGIGYGGSCFRGDTTIRIRSGAQRESLTFRELWDRAGGDQAALDGEAIAPRGLEVWSWVPGEDEPEWMPVSVLTMRPYDGEMIEIRTEAGEGVSVTADHPFIVGDGRDAAVLTRVLARDLTDDHWLPVAARALQAQPVPVAASFADETEFRSAYRGENPSRHRRFASGPGWARVAAAERGRFSGAVYSLKVPGSQTVVISGGLICSQCFPKDLKSLKQLAGNTGYHFQLLTAVIEVNELQKRRVIAKLQKHLGSLVGKKVALLGLAFKPDTDDMREASSLVLASRLQGEGASVRGYDPVAEQSARELLPDVDFAGSAEEALDTADAAVLVTEWPQFAELDWKALAGRMATPVLIDGRNFLDPGTLRDAGFTYEGIGRQ